MLGHTIDICCDLYGKLTWANQTSCNDDESNWIFAGEVDNEETVMLTKEEYTKF